MRALIAATAVAALLVGLMWVLSRPFPGPRVSPEGRRKIIHVAMALALTPLPWAFDGPVPSIVLGLTCVVFLVAVRRVAALRTALGPAILDVERVTYGDLYFVAGAVLAFLLAEGTPLRFILPVLILGLADPAAAIAGAWVKRRSRTAREGKTVAGFVAFAAVTWIVSIGGCLVSGMPPAPALLTATALAPTIAAAEAVCRGGLDNLVIPVAAAVLLRQLPWSG